MENMQMSFLLDEEAPLCEVTKKLNVVEAEFKNIYSMNWEDLFQGFDELYAITYSSGIDFISRVLPNFRYAEIIFGCEAVIEDNVAMIMSVQFSQLKFISKHKSAKMLSERMENNTLKLLVSRLIKSHEKIYILKADDGRVRVITGSANFSYSAFNGVQRENITYMDNPSAFEYYFELFNEFKEECADNVEHTSMTRMIVSPDTALDDFVEIVPIAETLKVTNRTIILEESDNPEYIIAADASNISKDIKPLLPQKEKSGKTILAVSHINTLKRKYKQAREVKAEQRRKMPQLHIDIERKSMSFNDTECNLSPASEAVQADLQRFLEYMDGFDVFSGDVEKNKRAYFLFTCWYLASPFMPYLRCVAHNNGQDIKQFPVYAILYGESNGGKTAFINLLTKMMCGKNIPVNRNNDFTNTTIDGLKQSCEGLPIVIDELSKTQYTNHIGLVKYDAWGLKENLLFYPSVAITTNEIPSIKSDISKRVFVCHIDSCLDKDKGRANFKKITSCMNDMTTAFYCEYVRRMLTRIDNMVAQMKGSDDSYLPDIFAESSATIIEIASEFFDELPHYMYECDYNDYFGNKAVGRNAIQKICRAWEFERESFTIHKKKGLLEYRIPDNGNIHSLNYIRQELPPSLNAQVISRTLTMNLEAASEFFGIDFKISLIDRLRRK